MEQEKQKAREQENKWKNRREKTDKRERNKGAKNNPCEEGEK